MPHDKHPQDSSRRAAAEADLAAAITPRIQNEMY